jgi:hypothetical protein
MPVKANIAARTWRFDPPQGRAHGLQLRARRRGGPHDELDACAAVIRAALDDPDDRAGNLVFSSYELTAQKLADRCPPC